MKYKEGYRRYLIAKLEILKAKVKSNIDNGLWSSSVNNWQDGIMIGILDSTLHSFVEDTPKALSDIQIDLNTALAKYGEPIAMSYEEFVESQRNDELNKLGI